MSSDDRKSLDQQILGLKCISKLYKGEYLHNEMNLAELEKMYRNRSVMV